MKLASFPILLTVVMFNLSCGVDPKAPTDAVGTGTLPTVPAAAGQITFSLSSTFQAGSVSGYVVGKKDLLKVEAAEGGMFFINNVPAGNHDIILYAKSASSSFAFSLDSSARDSGVRIEKVEVLNGIRTEKENVKLDKLIDISGNAKLLGQANHSGIDVYVPGTDLIAKTDDNGDFSIKGVPSGTHNFYFERDGYHRGKLEGFKVLSASNAQNKLPQTLLAVSTGAEGFLLTQDGQTTIASRTVSLVVGSSEDALLMKISEKESFEGTKWVSISPTASYTFDSDGNKKLYVKFANANGLESSPYSLAVTIDTTAPVFDSNASQFNTNGYATAGINTTFSISDLSGVKDFRYALPNEDITSKQWQTFTSTFTFPYANKISLQFRDAVGNTSDKIEKNITYYAQTTGSRRYNTTVAVGQKILFAGGNSETYRPCGWKATPSDIMDIFDVATNSWKTEAMPIAWTGAQTIVYGSKVLFYGIYMGPYDCGSSPPNTYSGSLYEYDTITGSWRTLVQPAGQSYGEVYKAGNKIVFTGLYNVQSQTYPAEILLYDTTNGSAQNVTISFGRSSGIATINSDNSKLLIAGGRYVASSAQVSSNHFDIINLQTQSTISSGTLPVSSGYRIGVAVVGDRRFFSLKNSCSLFEWDVSGNAILSRTGGEGYCYELIEVGGKIVMKNANSAAVFDPASNGWQTQNLSTVGSQVFASKFGQYIFFSANRSTTPETSGYAIFNAVSSQWTFGETTGRIAIGEMGVSLWGDVYDGKLYFVKYPVSSISVLDLATGAFSTLPIPQAILDEQDVEGQRLSDRMTRAQNVYISDGSADFFEGRIWFLSHLGYRMRYYDLILNQWSAWFNAAGNPFATILGKHYAHSLSGSGSSGLFRISPETEYIGNQM